VVSQVRGGRVLFVEPFHEGERLRKPHAVVELESKQERQQINLREVRLPMLDLREMHEDRLVPQSLQIERDAYPKCGRAAEVGVKLHNAGAIFTLNSVTPSMPARSSSPGLTGPTPAGVPVKMMSPGSSV